MNLRSGVASLLAGAVMVDTGEAQSAPNFGAPTILPAVFMVGGDVVAGDLNGDGIADLLQANPGLAMGTNFVSFRGKLLERDGSTLADVTGAAPAGTPSLAASARMASGDFDEDGLDDIVAITLSLAIGVSLNQGQSATFAGLGSSVLVDDLTRVFYVPWPVVLHVPVFRVADFDADGHLDLLVVPALADHLGQRITSPGMFVYFGNGNGTFAPAVQATLGSAPVDADWIDWDGDGVAETLVVLGQFVPNATTYTTDITRYRFANRIVQQVGTTQPTGTPMFVTSLAHASGGASMGGQHAFFLTGHTMPSTWTMRPEMCVVEVSPQGVVTATNTINLPMSVAAGTYGDLHAGKVEDFDGDGHLDFVAMHAQDTISPAELVWMMGPLDTLGSHGGWHQTSLGVFADTVNSPPARGPGFLNSWYPNASVPEAIVVTDLDFDQMPDLLLGNLKTTTLQATQMLSATLRNLATPSTVRGHVRELGPARQTPAGLRPRCGTNGAPVLGNADFTVTLTDAPRDALVASMAGIMPASFSLHGLTFTFVPEQYGALQWLHSSAEGASRACHPLPVPNDPAFSGMTAFFQWMVYDAGANDPLPLFPSNSLEIQFAPAL